MGWAEEEGFDIAIILRGIACSNDHWKTSVNGAFASYSQRRDEDGTAHTARLELGEGGLVIVVEIASCNPSVPYAKVEDVPKDAPNKQALWDGCFGMNNKTEGDSVSERNIGTMPVHLLAGDPSQ
jgi:hypothetical protein